jgi:ribosome biogenesis GTPase
MSKTASGIIETKIEDFGYDNFFESNRRKLGLDGFSVARVTSEHKGAYTVINTNGEFLARITGKQMFNASSREDYPAVGDWVAITELEAHQAVIHATLPRRSIIKRRSGDKNKIGEKIDTQIIATNIDVALVTESVGRDYNLNRFERYLALVEEGGVKPAIILNKIDLASDEELKSKLSEIKSRFSGINIIPTSTVSATGLDELKNYILPGKTYCFLGSSGIGKSSLINRLLGEGLIRTGDISSYSGRGKHTTTGREMYFLANGSFVIDNPGMREVGMIDATEGLGTLFDDIEAFGQMCKFVDCKHTQEPGCHVLKLLKSGSLDKSRYANYIRLKKEAEFTEMTELEKKEKDRKFGKFIKKTKKELSRQGHKEY